MDNALASANRGCASTDSSIKGVAIRVQRRINSASRRPPLKMPASAQVRVSASSASPANSVANPADSSANPIQSKAIRDARRSLCK